MHDMPDVSRAQNAMNRRRISSKGFFGLGVQGPVRESRFMLLQCLTASNPAT